MVAISECRLPKVSHAPFRYTRQGPKGSNHPSYEGRRMRSAGDQGGHEVVVPGGGFALALEARLQCRVGAREVERDLAEQGQVPGCGTLAHPAGIFAEADIEYPVKSILDRP